jgi:hypothetical protein
LAAPAFAGIVELGAVVVELSLVELSVVERSVVVVVALVPLSPAALRVPLAQAVANSEQHIITMP